MDKVSIQGEDAPNTPSDNTLLLRLSQLARILGRQAARELVATTHNAPPSQNVPSEERK